MKLLIKINRIASWVLLIVIITYGITGYGMTKGLISYEIARSLHLEWLGAIGLIAFIIHTSWSIHLAFKRHNIWNSFTKILLFAFYLFLILFFGYVHFFYQEGEIQKELPEQNIYENIDEDIDASTVFTAETLKKYDGTNGNAAYVAVDGIVYDMSKIFRNGNHHGYKAGQDLTSEFHKEHPDKFLEDLTIVGTYSE